MNQSKDQVFSAYSAYYDLLYQDKDYQGEVRYVIDRLTNALGRKPTAILELGCGTGHHAEYFVADEIAITGVDQSASMIDQARNRLPQSHFIQGDVRTVKVNQVFDSVISLFHVASYQTQNADISAYLKTAADHLPSGGVFLFDFWYGPAVYAQKPMVRVKRMQNQSVMILRTAEPVHRHNDCTVEVNYEVWVQNKHTNVAERIQESHLMRYYFLPELVGLLGRAGFDESGVRFEEWLTGSEPGENTWGVMAIARKL